MGMEVSLDFLFIKSQFWIQSLENMYRGLQEYNTSLQQYNTKLQSDVDATNEALKRVEKEKVIGFAPYHVEGKLCFSSRPS
ncbi:hypothetical protein ACS0TY_003695 [Phlomoides rotata]